MTRPRRYHDSRPPQDTNSPVKLMFGLYQCLHHLSFLTGGGDTGKTKPFARKVEELDRFFIPALPTLNSAFRKRCHATNEKWRTEQIGNLTEHYNWSIEVLKGSISAHLLTQSDMTQYLNQTKKWAKQHFKRKFQNHLFEQVDQMVRKFTIPEQTFILYLLVKLYVIPMSTPKLGKLFFQYPLPTRVVYQKHILNLLPVKKKI